MPNSTTPLIEWTDKGLYCAVGDFFIDPHRAVGTAIVTHAHSDHARRGSQKYLCAEGGLGLLKCRLGPKIVAESMPYGQSFQLGKVTVSLHSAGHILGSAQVRVEYGGEVWVVSGDYKRDPDPSCEPFEVVPCDAFITEATFGTPKYQWEKGKNHGKEIYQWWKENAALGKNSLLFGYSLGKAQRILAELYSYAERPILIHESIDALTQCYREENRQLAPTLCLDSLAEEKALQGELLLAPPSILKTPVLSRLGHYATAFASGWMQGSSVSYRGSYDHGFILSDHADWNDLNQTIQETGAKQVFVAHRLNGVLIRHLKKKGLQAHPITALTRSAYQGVRETNLSLF